MKIVFIGGHVTPVLATIDALKKISPKVEMFFVGRMHSREGDKSISAEYEQITKINIPFFAIQTGRLQRRFTRYTIPSLLKIPLGLWQSFWYLNDLRPDVVVSFGGYVAVPVVIAAKFLGVKIVTHEQTLVPGLANKIISRFADIVALSFEQSKMYYPHAKIVVTGNPIRKEIFVQNGVFKVARDLPLIYITGGNQGSHNINSKIFNLLPKLLDSFNVVHQTGNSTSFNDFEAASKLKSLNDVSKGEYFVFDYVNSEIIGDILNIADLIVTRAGANTLCELLALSKKAIMIPIAKTSHGEQLANARMYVSSGLGEMIEEKDLTEDLLFEKIMVLLNKKIESSTKDFAKKLIKLNSAEVLAQIILNQA